MDSPQDRRALLSQLEAERGSRVIAFITGDRRGAETRIGMDVFPYFYDVLTNIGRTKRLDVLLYSTGGLTMAAWGLANLIREFCEEFHVLIPFKAHSTATLLALGADEIVMGRMGQLSPVDPTVTGPFNPLGPHPAQPNVQQILPLSVEDVLSYLKLAQDEADIGGKTSMAQVFNKLSDTVKPIALGSVYRAKEQIKLLAGKLLAFHMDEKTEKARIEGIIKYLTRDLFSHDYLISRREARQHLKLKVAEAPEPLEKLMWKVFSAYADAIELNVPYTPAAALAGEDERTVQLDGAFIESTEIGFVYRRVRTVKKLLPGQIPGMPAVTAFQEEALSEGWVKA